MKVAVIGSGNIGTDLVIKVLKRSTTLEMAALVGIDPASDGLAKAAELGVPTTARGVEGLVGMPGFEEVEIVFDATSASAHVTNAEVLAKYGKRVIDLTPAAIGPMVVPTVNLHEHLGARNVNMVTCGGQATIPIVAAMGRVTPVPYAEIVASIASRSAGPGTRANIDEFTETTAHAIAQVGGAKRGKAVIVLNPADPPVTMRDTVLALVNAPDPETHQRLRASVEGMVAEVAGYVPGYRLKQQVQIDPVARPDTLTTDPVTHQVTVLLEVEGAADYLPAFAGNLDIMTSAALRVAETMAEAAVRA
ncbi:acetaldehyde dehydrogenase (acetylating) [Lentzea sp.]|uniref:acetaldehyde dehydrogenase (acetylating) n=1 Tax=Lentzea sp. TaxID=56099 RepID=UPI002C6D1F82|nr:acetaldehyde dehydrogenase (acetylating) [Lentzea sp.]HUQ60603.1 acetaldehyde dehydrogenase (acetylating) [Lentzea sp.]